MSDEKDPRNPGVGDEFAVIFKGPQVEELDEMARAWGKNRPKAIELACALLKVATTAKFGDEEERATLMKMNEDGVITIIELE